MSAPARWIVNRPRGAASAADFEPAWAWHDMERAFYAEAASTPETRRDVSVGVYYAEGGCLFEWTCRWPVLAGKPAFKMEMFGDSLKAFAAAPDRDFFMELCARADEFDDKAAFLKFLSDSGCFDLTAVERLPDGVAFEAAASRALARMEAEQIGAAASLGRSNRKASL